MGLIAKDSGSNYTPPPAGMHVARCYQIIDIGMQHGEYQGKPVSREQFILGWELPEEMVETESGEHPATISEFYTNTLSEKGKLRPMLESWRGRQFSREELDGFDLHNIIGKPCMINVVHETKQNGEIRAKVSSVTPLPKKMECPAAINKPVVFDIDNPDMELYDSFSDGIKGLIGKSDNWKARTARNGRPPANSVDSTPGAYDIPADDDIPF